MRLVGGDVQGRDGDSRFVGGVLGRRAEFVSGVSLPTSYGMSSRFTSLSTVRLGPTHWALALPPKAHRRLAAERGR